MKVTTTTALLVLSAIALIGVIVIIMCNKVVPAELWATTTVLIGATAGVAIPAISNSGATTTSETAAVVGQPQK